MPAAMARQERDFLSSQLSDHIVVRRRAPRAVERDFFMRFKARHGIQPAAADNADGWFHS